MNAGNTHSSNQRNASNATHVSHTVKALALTLTILLSEVTSYGMPIIYCLTLSQAMFVCACAGVHQGVSQEVTRAFDFKKS